MNDHKIIRALIARIRDLEGDLNYISSHYEQRLAAAARSEREASRRAYEAEDRAREASWEAQEARRRLERRW